MDEIEKMYDKRVEYYSNPRPEMLEFVPTTIKKALDVGCGRGDFAALLKETFNAEVWGIDIDKDSIEIAKTRIDKAFYGDFLRMLDEFPNNYFDVISFNDVLEHTIDPYTILQELKPKLSKDGVVVSSIPNVRYFKNLVNLLYKKDWQYEDEGILDRTHLRFFTEKSIQGMYEQQGYEVLKMKGLDRSPSIRPTLYNIFSMGAFASDCRFLRFGTMAKPRS